LFLTPVEPLVPRALCFEIKERVGHDGSVITPLDLSTLPQIALAIKQAKVDALSDADNARLIALRQDFQAKWDARSDAAKARLSAWAEE
jgi:hypothetical protein